MNKPNISCIFLDMDGCTCDFNKRYIELYGMHPREAEKQSKFYHLFEEFIATSQFESLDLMPDTMEGIEFLRKASVPTQILSSTVNEELYPRISKQKMIWLQKHGITFNSIFVPGKKHKYKHAAPDKIIIDDTESVIDDWRKAGGIAIHHHDWATTISMLKMYV